MELGPQRTRYPSPDEQRMTTWYWWNYIKDRRRSIDLETKRFQGFFVHPERSENTCDKPMRSPLTTVYGSFTTLLNC